MINKFKILLFIGVIPLCAQTSLAKLSDINISNGNLRSSIIFRFKSDPEYAFFKLNSYSIELDIKQTGVIVGLPLQFNGNNLMKSIRSGAPKDNHSLRLVVDLIEKSKIKAVKQHHGMIYTVIFTIEPDVSQAHTSMIIKHIRKSNCISQLSKINHSFKVCNNRTATSSVDVITHLPISTKIPYISTHKITIAIDAGHGGQDPGAISIYDGKLEKNITIAIAQKLLALLNNDPMFKGIMTRNNDYFISVIGRSELARKQNANLLVSIHADAALNRNARGTSVWVLSKRRANSELAHWLKEYEKQSKLLGGAGYILTKSQAIPYFSQAVLDLQFSHSQHVSYEVATNVLHQLKRISYLHKNYPQYASLGILRSPDIPSILVETGFISNNGEEHLLINSNYQKKIANAIYHGIRNYFSSHSL